MKYLKHFMIASAMILPTAPAITLPSLASAENAAAPARISPLSSGYLERARELFSLRNYAGVIDQLGHIATGNISLSDSQTEECAFLMAMAKYERGDSDCISLLREFVSTYPASSKALEAQFKIADFYFFHHLWPEAVEAYQSMDVARLNAQDADLYAYRYGLSLIKTGYFPEARIQFRKLADNKDYADSYNFYTAYLDYVEGKFKDAYSRFERVTPSIPGLESGYYMTQIEYVWGRYSDVIKHGESLLKKNPVEELVPELRRIVGISYFKEGSDEVAEGFLESYFSKTDPQAWNRDALYAMGAIQYNLGNYEKAAECFSELTDGSDELSQSAWLYIGQCYLKSDNFTSAAMAFERSARINADPKVSETALYNYVTSLTRGGKVPFSSSSDLLEDFVKKYPDSQYAPEVEAYLATAYYNDRKYEKALSYVEKVTDPGTKILGLKQKILYELGVQRVSNGESAGAVKPLQQAASMQKQDAALAAQASLWLGDALYSLSRYKEARSAYAASLQGSALKENRAAALYDLAYSEYKCGDYQAAAGSFAKALNTRPPLDSRQSDDARVRRADCLYYFGQYSEAGKLYSDAISGDAIDSDYALYRRAIMHGLEGNINAKLADINKLEKEYPQSAWLSKALLEAAHTYEETGRRDLASDAYRKRLNIATNLDIDELLQMARTMQSAGRNKDLLEVIEKIQRTGGLEADETAEISLYQADALATLNRASDARTIYKELAQNPTSLPGAKAAVILAEQDIKSGNYEKARVAMEEFTDAGTPHQYWLARGYIALADAYSKLDKEYLAKEYLISLRDNYPDNNDDIHSLISSRLKKMK